jgi:hypothetical protein
MSVDVGQKIERRELFAGLPVGRSAEVRLLLIVSALLTGGCLFWIQHLRATGDPGSLTPIFFVLFSFYDHGAAMLALGILLVAMFVPRRSGFDLLLARLGAHPYRIAAIVTLLLSLGAWFVYRAQPLAMDEYTPLFQSQVFATGHLSGHFPPDLMNFLIPEGFQNYFLNVSRSTGEVSSNYWPSFALLLTPFSMLGIPWACNPVLAGLTVVALNRLSLRLLESVEAAGLVTLLTLASPVFFANGISFYSMTAHLLANVLFATLVLDPTPRRLFTAGVVGSIALTLHNPVPHALFALPWFVWLATRDKPVGKLAVLCAGYLPLSLLLGIGWFLHTGQLTADVATQAGTGTLQGVASAFAWPTPVLFYARLVGMAKLHLWAVPCLLVLGCAGAWKTRQDARFVTLGASALLTLFGYLFVWVDQGHGWGFRYFHSAWLVLPLFAAAFLFTPSAQNPLPAPRVIGPSSDGAELRTYVIASALLCLVAGVALRASQMNEFISGHLGQLPRYGGTEPRVVFIAGVGFYPYDLVQNDPFLRKNEVRMVDQGAENNLAAMTRHFPGYRRVYRDGHGEVWSAASPPAALRH